MASLTSKLSTRDYGDMLITVCMPRSNLTPTEEKGYLQNVIADFAGIFRTVTGGLVTTEELIFNGFKNFGEYPTSVIDVCCICRDKNTNECISMRYSYSPASNAQTEFNSNVGLFAGTIGDYVPVSVSIVYKYKG